MTSSSTLERVQTPRLLCERLRMEHVPEVCRLLLDPHVFTTLWPDAAAPTEQEVIESTAEKERHWERYGFGLWLVRPRDRRDGRSWRFAVHLRRHAQRGRGWLRDRA